MRKVTHELYVHPNGTTKPGEYRTLNGIFHKWGNDYEEFESGPGNFSVGIIEKPDGQIILIRADKIRFIN